MYGRTLEKVRFDELYHHGVLGQKWGVRRYQNKDGSYTSQGEGRYANYDPSTGHSLSAANVAKNAAKGGGGSSSGSKQDEAEGEKKKGLSPEQKKKIITGVVAGVATVGVGVAIANHVKQSYGEKFSDQVLSAGTEFSRIQAEADFNKDYAWYGTYQQHDIDKYAGLYGTAVTKRTKAIARDDIAKAIKEGDLEKAEKIKQDIEGFQVKQVMLKTTGDLHIPSENKAGQIVGDLLKDKQFSDDLQDAIADAKTRMKRPSQQLLFAQAAKLAKKDPSTLSDADKRTIYKAVNLSLTWHEKDSSKNVQKAFYGKLKEAGYDAVTDINDQKYSTYHAKHPVIVFNNDKIEMASITPLDEKSVAQKYAKYNVERAIKEVPEQAVGTVAKSFGMKVDGAYDYLRKKTDEYTARHSK